MKFTKKPVIIISLFLITIATMGGYFYFWRGFKKTPDEIIVRRGDITQEVTITGRVKSARTVDLAFERTGRVDSVLADVGNYVTAGQVLTAQDKSELSAQLAKANADLASQQSDLDKTKLLLNNYYSNTPNILNDSYTKADDAVRNQADSMFSNAETDNPQLAFSSTESQANTDVRNGRLSVRAELKQWRAELDQLNPTSQDDVYQALIKAQNHISIIRNFLVRLMDALNQSYGLSQNTINTYKTSIITGRAELNTALTNINNQLQTIDAQKASINSSAATVKSYQASVQNTQAQLAKSVLYAPINGVVTRQDAKVGQIASANTIVVSIISVSRFEIESNVPEIDIGKIATHNSVRITLDAFHNETFSGKVKIIDPAETIVDGVVNFKVTIAFDKEDSRFKSGMTANLNIVTLKKLRVLILPQVAIVENDQGTFVRKLKDNSVTEVPVKIGVRSQDGTVEITDGLSEGERVANVAIKTAK